MLGAELPVVISTGDVVSGVSLLTAWPAKSTASLPAASCATLPVVGLVELTLPCSRFSTARLRVSVMVLFTALTLALLTVMGVAVALVTVKPALAVRAAGSRLLASVSLSTRWGPVTLGAEVPVVISTGGVRSGLVTDWFAKSATSLPAASCMVVGLLPAGLR